jgi:hypothetical protein
MKSRFLFFFLLYSAFSLAQIKIEGTVYDSEGVLEGAAVYLNNTMLGTTTDINGKFMLPVKIGQYDLIVSYLGYKKINYSLNTSSYSKPLVFALEKEENTLDEIVIKKIVYDDEWKYNFKSFRNEFIGRNDLAKDCKILNPKDVYFNYNKKTNTLKAYTKKPLKIKHKSLGYLITYELESFIRNKNYITYLGYSKYKELKGGKRKQKLWKKNRKKAYNGSQIHFYKSILNNTFSSEGFIVNQFKRVPNPKRPSEDEIKKARQLLFLNRGLMIDFSKKITIPKNALDSALVTVRKSRLPKFADYLYRSKLKKEEIITFKNNVHHLTFDNNLSIVYTREKEEMGYITRNVFSKKRKPLSQTSSIIPLNKKIILDITGVLVNPLDVIYEGYWSYEKFASSLPLDYVPNN